jgi:fimbrial chaperone protein
MTATSFANTNGSGGISLVQPDLSNRCKTSFHHYSNSKERFLINAWEDSSEINLKIF